MPTIYPNTSLTASRKCGSEADQSKLAEYENQFQHDRIEFTDSQSDFTPAIINVYFHVILPGGDNPDGQVLYVLSLFSYRLTTNWNSPLTNTASILSRDQQVYDQLDTLNSDYSDTGLSFRLTQVDRTVNSDWFYNGGPGT
jgi:hypothetical protein